jgi:hypothetical protein
MKFQDDIHALTKKKLCFTCVDEAYLSAEIRGAGKVAKCSYCGSRQKGYTIEAMAERIAEVFEEHYTRTSDQPDSFQQMMMSDPDGSYEFEREGEEVIYAIENAAKIPLAAAHDIQVILEEENAVYDHSDIDGETEFAAESHYEEKGSNIEAWHDEWTAFERSLKTEARFFSQTAAKHLYSVFGEIDKMKTKKGKPLIVDAGPGAQLTAFYRARAFQSEDKLIEAMGRPDKHLGSAPANLSSAGRMNAKGISVFYGAGTSKVALAEVRPPVGSQALVGRFEVIRPLRLLDLTALRHVVEHGSIFDRSYGRRLERAMFLRFLSQNMTRPVMPDDEAFEYLPTQAVADFLATQKEPAIDGILFASVQAAGDDLNVVLFHKAARVETYEVPKGTRIEGSTNEQDSDGVHTNFSVIEWVPPEEKKPDPLPGWPDFAGIRISPWIEPDLDSREPALRVDMKSLTVHRINKVEYDTTEYDVSRNRYQKRDGGF